MTPPGDSSELDAAQHCQSRSLSRQGLPVWRCDPDADRLQHWIWTTQWGRQLHSRRDRGHPCRRRPPTLSHVKTRTLIILSLICGLALVVAFAIQAVQIF